MALAKQINRQKATGYAEIKRQKAKGKYQKVGTLFFSDKAAQPSE